MSLASGWAYRGEDSGLRLFGSSLRASGCDVPVGARVLEIGCAEADWLSEAQLADPTLDLHGIDWRRCPRPGRIVHGDVLTYTYPARDFDAIVSISAIEHIGLGHYSDDPIDPEGDCQTSARMRDWLADDGVAYFDVPYSATAYQVHGTEYRVYDDAALRERLLPGWQVIAQHYAPTKDAGTLCEKPTMGPGFTHYVALWVKKA